MGIDAIDAIDAIDTIEEGIEGDFLNRGSVSCQNNRPYEAHRFGCGGLHAALQASPRLQVVHDMPSPMAGFAPRLWGGWQRGAVARRGWQRGRGGFGVIW